MRAIITVNSLWHCTGVARAT